LLTEEREVIALRALVALERMEEARVRARAFVRDYPGSGHASAVKKAVGEEG
jgi:hypothetical protein